MNMYAKILEVARRPGCRKALQHVYVSKNGIPYAFDDWGNLIGKYEGNIPCSYDDYPMPPELEAKVLAQNRRGE